MKKIDERSMRRSGITSYGLMKRVAAGMADEISKRFPPATSVLVLCGPGNNGGDAYILAEILRQRKFVVRIDPVFSPQTEDCKKAAKACRAKKISYSNQNFDLILDGIFGAQGRSTIAKELEKKLQKINAASAFRIALDLPTGIDAVKGRAAKHSFYADLCLCVAYPKQAFLYEEVAERLGDITYVGQEFFIKPDSHNIYALEDSDFSLPEEKRTKHKTGRCGIFAGSANTAGAAFLCAEAAHRTGLGYVDLFLPQKRKWKIELRHSSFLLHTNWNWKRLPDLNSVVLGPGGSPKNLKALEALRIPQIIDADALGPVWKLKASPERIFTPHPAEAARLLRISTRELQRERLAALKALAELSEQAIYLKGAPGLLFLPKTCKYYVNLSIRPEIARAGSGDVLAGLMGGFCAQMGGRFSEAVISALVFQAQLAKLLKKKRAAIAYDQLNLFSEAFSQLSAREN